MQVLSLVRNTLEYPVSGVITRGSQSRVTMVLLLSSIQY